MKEKKIVGEHLLLYDGQCGLCDRVVQWVAMRDSHRRFCFAPLEGETAAPFLKQLLLVDQNRDSVILIDSFRSPDRRIYVRSQAVWRVLWHVGRIWSVLGALNFLPGWLFDWGYRLLSRMRYRLFGLSACRLPVDADRERFLP